MFPEPSRKQSHQDWGRTKHHSSLSRIAQIHSPAHLPAPYVVWGRRHQKLQHLALLTEPSQGLGLPCATRLLADVKEALF